jgi:hypothetical protein
MLKLKKKIRKKIKKLKEKPHEFFIGGLDLKENNPSKIKK